MKTTWFRFVVTSSVLIVVGACSLTPTLPPRSFAIDQLLLNVSVFPPGWMESAEGPSRPASAPLGGETSIERIRLSFYVDYGGASEEIHRYSSKEEANRKYEAWSEFLFAQREYQAPWAVPPELPYTNSTADRSHFACTESGGNHSCQFLGQYEEYILIFNTFVSTDFMTYTDLKRILEAIDERMADYLKTEGTVCPFIHRSHHTRPYISEGDFSSLSITGLSPLEVHFTDSSTGGADCLVRGSQGLALPGRLF